MKRKYPKPDPALTPGQLCAVRTDDGLVETVCESHPWQLGHGQWVIQVKAFPADTMPPASRPFFQFELRSSHFTLMTTPCAHCHQDKQLFPAFNIGRSAGAGADTWLCGDCLNAALPLILEAKIHLRRRAAIEAQIAALPAAAIGDNPARA